jgi:hypothetical protein
MRMDVHLRCTAQQVPLIISVYIWLVDLWKTERGTVERSPFVIRWEKLGCFFFFFRSTDRCMLCALRSHHALRSPPAPAFTRTQTSKSIISVSTPPPLERCPPDAWDSRRSQSPHQCETRRAPAHRCPCVNKINILPSPHHQFVAGKPSL